MPLLKKKSDKEPQLICWSAQHPESLAGYAQKLHTFLEANPAIDLSQLAYTINTTRQDLAVRNFIVARNTGDLVAQLAQTDVITAASYRVKEKTITSRFCFRGRETSIPIWAETYMTMKRFTGRLWTNVLKYWSRSCMKIYGISSS
ncbi:hypothetical protein LWM68_13085 [Niabella sp. W65]|nr:hypothetical protein [Niabella sp. W65]MCH7363601.1 hypothetical protein [Niabella sp. W65]ULT39516.1 hypothetical protein KRR40_31885 [Niabella sp. I65]